jgi:hypothetical protein
LIWYWFPTEMRKAAETNSKWKTNWSH